LTAVETWRSDGVYFIVDGDDRRLATENLVPGTAHFGERTVEIEGTEYRLWSPYRSKLSSAILSGLSNLDISRGSRVLYLGAASGTTASYVSDIVGDGGAVYCVEFAPRPMRELLRMSRIRKNIVPILSDARKPEGYSHLMTEVEFIYQDVAQPNQGQIFCSNSEAYLDPSGSGLLMVKSRSVDVAKRPDQVFRQTISDMESGGLRVTETVGLNPFVKDHIAIAAVNGEK